MTQINTDEQSSVDALLDALRSRTNQNPDNEPEIEAVDIEATDIEATGIDNDDVIDGDDTAESDEPTVRGPIVLPAMYTDTERSSSVEDGHVSDHLATHWGF